MDQGKKGIFENINRRIILIVGIIILLFVAYYYFGQSQPVYGEVEYKPQVSEYLQLKERLMFLECNSLRPTKQKILNTMEYTESIKYANGKSKNTGLNIIDSLLIDGISTIKDCKGINYHGVSLGVGEVQAGDPKIEDEIKENSEEWDGIHKKKIIMTERQDELHNMNNFLRKQLPKTIVHKGYAKHSPVQDYVSYAYEVGGMDLVKLIECEMGTWNPHGLGDKGKSYGLCQIHRGYHTPPQEFYDDWRYQIRYCNKKRLGGTKFYGPTRIIKGQKCSDYVDNRFTINQN